MDFWTACGFSGEDLTGSQLHCSVNGQSWSPSPVSSSDPNKFSSQQPFEYSHSEPNSPLDFIFPEIDSATQTMNHIFGDTSPNISHSVIGDDPDGSSENYENPFTQGTPPFIFSSRQPFEYSHSGPNSPLEIDDAIQSMNLNVGDMSATNVSLSANADDPDGSSEKYEYPFTQGFFKHEDDKGPIALMDATPYDSPKMDIVPPTKNKLLYSPTHRESRRSLSFPRRFGCEDVLVQNTNANPSPEVQTFNSLNCSLLASRRSLSFPRRFGCEEVVQNPNPNPFPEVQTFNSQPSYNGDHQIQLTPSQPMVSSMVDVAGSVSFGQRVSPQGIQGDDRIQVLAQDVQNMHVEVRQDQLFHNRTLQSDDGEINDGGQASNYNQRNTANRRERRQRHPFSPEETQKLVDAVRTLGKRWAEIKRRYFPEPDRRTRKDLQDKWKTLRKTAGIDWQDMRGECLSVELLKEFREVDQMWP